MREPLLIEQMQRLFELLDLSLCKSMSVKVHVWFESCLKWQEQRRRVLSFSTKLTQSEVSMH